MEHVYIISQILGALGGISVIIGPLFPSRTKVLLMYALSNIFWGSHFLLLGAMTGGVMSFVGSMRFIIAIHSRHKAWLVAFLGINAIVTYLTWDTLMTSGIAFLSASLIILGPFMKQDTHMRIMVILGTLGWLIYDIMIGTVIGTLFNTGFLISGVIGYIRYRPKSCS